MMYIRRHGFPLLASNPINDWLHIVNLDGSFISYDISLVFCVPFVVLLLWHVGQASAKRLWLLPSHSSRILALNAGTLALLGIVAPKPLKPGQDTDCSGEAGMEADLIMLRSIVLLCVAIGAFMPSFAASTDLHDMWSNVTAVGLLVVSVNFVTFLQLFYIPAGGIGPTIQKYAMEHKVAMAALFLLFLVLLVQAIALEAMMSDLRSMVSQRLDQLCAVEAKPGYEAIAILEKRAWSWEVVEQNTHIKLMMALTSNPQNVMSRSPSAAIVGILALLCIIVLPKSDDMLMSVFTFQFGAMAVCCCICVWRWVRLALQEDRSFSSRAFAAEPSYWCRKAKNFHCRLKAGPQSTQSSLLEQGQCGFQEVLWYTAAFLMLHVVLPLHHLLVAFIRFPQILLAVAVQKIVWLPVSSVRSSIALLYRQHFQKSSRVVDATAELMSSTSFASLGVVCLEGEDAHIVQREFASAARRIVQRHLKKLAKKRFNFKHLTSLLQSFDNSKLAAGKSKAILDTLNQEGTPLMENLCVKHHGDQFGWRLTVLTLLELLAKIEVTTLGESTMSENAVTAYWQVMDMMQMVDEQFAPCLVCSKDIYASVCILAWSKIEKKKRRWTQKKMPVTQAQVRHDAIDGILRATMERTKRHMELELHNAQEPSHVNVVVSATWSQEIVISYTMHTVCKNLLTWWTNVVEAKAMANASYGGGQDQERHAECTMIKGMIKHINDLIGEIMACCLSNLPTAVDMSTSDEVQRGKISKIEKALELVARGKHIWEKLQWPTLYSHRHTGLGQLGQWMQ